MVAELDLAIVYEEGDDGWVIASIPQISGVFSQGRTREEARTNVIDALRLMLSPEPSDAEDRREREHLHLTIAARGAATWNAIQALQLGRSDHEPEAGGTTA